MTGWRPLSTLKAKVIWLVVLAVAGAVVPVGLALWVAGDFKQAIVTIQKDKIAPLEHLQRIETFVREVELRIPGVVTDWFSGPGAKAYIESALPGVVQSWEVVKGGRHQRKAATLVEEFDASFRKFLRLVPRLAEALGREDKAQITAIGNEWLDLKRGLVRPLDELLTVAREDVAREVETAERRLRRTTWGILAWLGGLLVVIIPISLILLKGVTVPLRRAMDVLKDLAQGEGDLTTRLPDGKRDEIGELALWFNRFMEKLHAIIGQVRATAHHVAGAAHQLSSATEHLSSGAQQQASSLEETAASLEEITGTVRQNADNANQANQLARASSEVAGKGGQIVTSTIEAMGEISRSSKKIAEIITAIDEIAFQTNLLALNAAVEAARAGDQGRGFAVVASEVRNLAQRSAEAAKEINTLIKDSVQKVEGGSALVNRSGQALSEIVGAVKHVTDFIAEIASASQEQAQGIDQVNRAVAQMDQVVQANAAHTEELNVTAQALAAHSAKLQALVGRFRLADVAPASEPRGASTPPLRSDPRRPRTPVPRPAPALAGVRAGDGLDTPGEEF
jgi:methyl-accepting chemotaxis protein